MQEGWIEYDSIAPTRQLRLVYEMLTELQQGIPKKTDPPTCDPNSAYCYQQC